MGIDEPDIDPATFLEDIEMRIGEIRSADPFPEARKDVYKLTVDFGSETRRSAAGLTDLYEPEDLVGRQVVAVVNLGTVSIAGFESECLVTGVDSGGLRPPDSRTESGDSAERSPADSRTASGDGEDGVVYLEPEREVENGTRVY